MAETEPETKPETEPETKPEGVFGDFTTMDLEGNEVNASVFAEHELTMVNIWGTYCPPCVQEMPDLGEIGREYAEKGLGIVGLVVDAGDYNGNPIADKVEKAISLADKAEADYLHILPSSVLVDSYLYKVQAIPTTVFVDANGVQVGKAYVGAKDKAGWLSVIDGLLAELAG